MAPSTKKGSAGTTTKKAASATTETSAVNENVSAATRKRGRSQATTSAKAGEAVVEEKTGSKKSDKSKEDIVDDLNVSSATTTKENNAAPVDGEQAVAKRKRGRPANKVTEGSSKKVEEVTDPSIPKRGRGRPKKVASA